MKYHLALIAALATPVLAADTGRAQDDPNLVQEEINVTQAGADTADPLGQVLELSDALAATPGEATRALIIPKEATEPKDLANIEEDLKIMAHILQKAAGGGAAKSHNAMGIAIHRQVFGRPSVPQNFYLEGYGALFFLSVNYPLVEPAVRKTESEAKDQTSSEWEEARRELAQPSGPQRLDLRVEQLLEFGGGAQEAEYDADRVETLKKDLMSALKNGSHIRRLKPDEAVTVVVAGRGGKAGTKLTIRHTGPSGAGMGGGMSGGGMSGMGGGMSGGGMVALTGRATDDGQGSRLILRARKSDIDAFQKDKLSLDDFCKKVTVMAE